MRRRLQSVSQPERAASLVISTASTVAMVILILTALRFRQSAPNAEARDTNRSERVEYLVNREVGDRPAAARLVPTPARHQASAVETPSVTDSAVAAATIEATAPPATPPARTIVEGVTGATPRTPSGARVADAVVGFARGSRAVPLDSVLRAVTDSLSIGLLVGAIKPPPMTQAELDAKYRDEAFEVTAARGAGVPVRQKMIGVSVAVGLPLGGPSRKQRERDRAIYAQNLEIRALRQKRIDSVVAARKRRADSLARVADSARLEGKVFH